MSEVHLPESVEERLALFECINGEEWTKAAIDILAGIVAEGAEPLPPQLQTRLEEAVARAKREAPSL